MCLAAPFTLRDIHIHSPCDYYTVSTTRRLPEYRSSSEDCSNSPASAMSHFRCRHFFYDLGAARFAYGRNTGAITAPEPHSISRHRYVQGFAVGTGVGEPRSACHRFQFHEDGSRRLVNRSTRGSRTNCRVVIPIRMSKLQNRAGNFDHR